VPVGHKRQVEKTDNHVSEVFSCRIPLSGANRLSRKKEEKKEKKKKC
jgi:hypothetical protein